MLQVLSIDFHVGTCISFITFCLATILKGQEVMCNIVTNNAYQPIFSDLWLFSIFPYYVCLDYIYYNIILCLLILRIGCGLLYVLFYFHSWSFFRILQKYWSTMDWNLFLNWSFFTDGLWSTKQTGCVPGQSPVPQPCLQNRAVEPHTGRNQAHGPSLSRSYLKLEILIHFLGIQLYN